MNISNRNHTHSVLMMSSTTGGGGGRSMAPLLNRRPAGGVGDENNLELFSKHRRPSDDPSSDVKIGRVSVGSVKLLKSGIIDDLLTSVDGGSGKHDYDWLLTPPGTPLFPSSDPTEAQPNPVAPRSSSLARSSSTTKASRLSVSQSENHHQPSRPTRSNSVTRPSVSSSQYSTYSSNRSTANILNTSSASVSSYIRPSSPVTRSSSAARPSTPSARPTLSRSSTPSRARPAPSNSTVDKPRPSSRPSTPTARPQISANLNSAPPTARLNSRPSTPTRRNPMPSTSPSSVPSSSTGRVVSNGRTSAPTSRPSSPSPRVRPVQPVIPPDFPLDTPPNLRTTLPDRPLSAGRSRPGAAFPGKGSPETTTTTTVARRHSSPIVSRGRVTEPPGRGRLPSNGHVDAPEPRKASHMLESGMRKPVKSSPTPTESTGFGRNISKKSLDMAIRHMDIRNGTGTNRPISGTLFPQSIRSAAQKTQSVRSSSGHERGDSGGSMEYRDISENGYHSRRSENGSESNDGRFSAKLSEIDIYESSRYDAILLKEDLMNMNWLHGADDKAEQGSIFDHGFEPLPEPFGLS